MADKTEKFCLNCGMGLGGGITLSSGVLGGIGAVAVNAWKPLALKAAIAAALEANNANILAAGIEAGEAAGMEFVIKALKHFGVENFFPEIRETISSIDHYANITNFVDLIYSQYNRTCNLMRSAINPTACYTIETKLSIKTGGPATQGHPPKFAIRELLKGLAKKAETNAEAAEAAKSAELTAEITEKQTALIEAGFNSSITSINASIIAILIIVLIMVIIYLILRYRRKKKMKKKLQYIKLLEE